MGYAGHLLGWGFISSFVSGSCKIVYRMRYAVLQVLGYQCIARPHLFGDTGLSGKGRRKVEDGVV